MADKEIELLQNASVLDGTELLHVVQGGNSRKTTSLAIGLLAGDGGDGLGYVVEKPPVVVQSAYARGDGSATVELGTAPTPGNTLVALITGWTPVKSIPGFMLVSSGVPNTDQGYSVLMREVIEGDGTSYTSTGSDWNNLALYEVSGLQRIDVFADELPINAGVFTVRVPQYMLGAGPKILGVKHSAGYDLFFDPQAAVIESHQFNGTDNHWGVTGLIDEGYFGDVVGGYTNITNPAYVLVGLRGRQVGTGPINPQAAYPAARHWRLRSLTPDPANEGFGFAEIDWLDKDGVSLVGTGTASASATDAGSDVTTAFDDDTQTGWFSGVGNAAVGAWIAYDFAATVSARTLKIAPLADKTWSAGKVIAVDVSSDGERWTQVATIDCRVGAADTLEDYSIPPQEVTVVSAATPNVPVTSHMGSLTLDEETAGTYLRVTGNDDSIVTVPAQATVSLPVGIQTSIVRAGAGAVSIAGENGVTLNSPESLNLRTLFSVVTLTKVGENEWDVTGDLEPGA